MTDKNFSPLAMINAHFDGVANVQLEKSLQDEVKSTLDCIAALIENHANSRATITGNNDFSESGKNSQIKALVQQSDKQLDELTAGTMDKLHAIVQTANKAMSSSTTHTASTDPFVVPAIPSVVVHMIGCRSPRRGRR